MLSLWFQRKSWLLLLSLRRYWYDLFLINGNTCSQPWGVLKFYKPENPRNNTKLKITRQKYDRGTRWRPKLMGTRILIGTSFIPNPFSKFPIIYGSIFRLFRFHLWSFYHLRKYLTIYSEFIFEVLHYMWKSHESLLSFIPNSFREDLLM